MDAFQIILLVLGVAVFVASFFLPGGKKEDTGSLKKEEKRIREALDEEMKNRLAQTSSQMDEMMEEKNNDVLERTERGLERISNEKMMAVNEYADTVLADINKNHADVVFLYSMLGDKQEELRGLLGDIDKGSKSAKKSIRELEEEITKYEEIKLSLEEARTELEAAEMQRKEVLSAIEADSKEPEEEGILPDVTELVEKFSQDMKSEKKSALEEDLKNEGDRKQKEKSEEKKRTRKKNPKIPEISSLPGGNSNEMILKLYQEGKSNVAIAKELGLGVGEVKLVIDLFKQS